jgi:predicted nucleic acid-binding protein
MRFLDANIFIRYLVEDDVEKTDACARLFGRLDRNEETATTCEAIIAEVVYVLSARAIYGLSAEEIASRLRPLILLPGLQLGQKRVYLEALDLYSSYHHLDFEDALAIAHIEDLHLTEITSYDRDFDRVPGVVRVEP